MTALLKRFLRKEDRLETILQDLRPPIDRIATITRCLLDTSLNAEQKADVIRLQEAADQIANFVNELHDFERLREGSLQIEKIPFSLRNALKKTIAQLQCKARERKIVLDFQIDPTVPDALVGDPVRVRQILENIGSEFIRKIFRLPSHSPFSGSGLRGGIRPDDPRKPDGAAHFYFEGDEGFPSLRESLPFEIATQLSSLMGGRLWQNQEKDQPRGLHLILPLQLQENPRVIHGRSQADLAGLEALIVSSYSIDQALLENALKSRQIETTVSSNAEEAFDLIRETQGHGEPFDLVLLDHLQGCSALQFVEKICAADLIDSTLVLLVVSNGQRGDATLCQQRGIAGYFVKPVLPSEILEAISLARQYQAEGKTPRPLITHHFLEEEDRRLKILYADHDPKKQKEAVRLLEFQGHQVLTATSGFSILSLMENQAFDLILIDTKIQGMDGLETTTLIRQKEKETGGHTPIIGISTTQEQDEQKKCLDAGMDIYIAQPLHASQFTDVIQKLGLDYH